MFYNCIEKPSLETFSKNSRLKKHVVDTEQELERLANLIEVKELTTNDLTMAEFGQYVKAFISHYHIYQAV